MHNLVVLDDLKGRYRLISGQKRWTAIQKMSKEEYEDKFPNGIACKVTARILNLQMMMSGESCLSVMCWLLQLNRIKNRCRTLSPSMIVWVVEKKK